MKSWMAQGDEMKGLVVLMLVAVCQGVAIRDSPPSQQVRVPVDKTIQILNKQRENREHELEEFIPGRLKQSLKTPIDSSKQWSKSPLQLSPLKEPFIQYTEPQTFLDYIKIFPNRQTWNSVTSMHPDTLDFVTFRDLIQFPGGDFLQNEIDKCLWNMRVDQQPVELPTKAFKKLPLGMEIDLANVQGVRGVLPYIVTELEKTVPLYMQVTNDPSTMALLVTRDLIKIILHGRMECPATTWDKQFIENINDQLYNTAKDEVDQLLENLGSVLPEVLPEFLATSQLVHILAQDVQQHVYKDILQYAHGVAFKDVAIVSHKLYHELKRVFQDSWQQDVSTIVEQLVSMVTEVIKDYGQCQREPIPDNNKLACWDFNKLFLERELANINSRVMNIVHLFLHRTCTEPDCMQYYPRVTEVLGTIIRRYISTIVQGVPICQTPECLDPTECLINQNLFPESLPLRRSWNAMDIKDGYTTDNRSTLDDRY